MVAKMKLKQLTIKISERVKKRLDHLKPYPEVSYDTVIDSLIGGGLVDSKLIDADWKAVKKDIEFMKCPKCCHLEYMVVNHSLHKEIDEYLMYGSVLNLNAMKTVMVNSKKTDFKSVAEVDEFLKGLRLKNPDAINIAISIREGFKINYDGLPDIRYGECHGCSEGIDIDDYNSGSKLLACYTCPKCGFEVFDDKHHKTFEDNILMCPSGHYFFDRNWEIFNHFNINGIDSHPTIDHVRYNKRDKIIVMHSYECVPDQLVRFLKIAERLGYIVRIYGHSDYHRDALSIHLYRRLKGNPKEAVINRKVCRA